MGSRSVSVGAILLLCGCDGSPGASDGGSSDAATSDAAVTDAALADAATGDAAIVDAATPDANACLSPSGDASDCYGSDAGIVADAGAAGPYLIYTAPGLGGSIMEVFGAQITDGVPGTVHRVSTAGQDVGFCCTQPGVRWSRDANMLVYSKKWSQREFFRVDMTTAPPGSPQLVNDYIIDQGRLYDIQWSNDGKRIAYSADAAVEDVIELYVVDVSAPPPWTSERVNVAFTSFDQDVLWYAFSADSRWLAYVANQDDTDDFDLYIADVSGATPGTPVRVNPSGELISSPSYVSWSPDGTRLVYMAAGAVGSGGGLWVANVDSTGAAAPTHLGINGYHAWSPVGRKLAVFQTQIHVIDMAGAVPGAPQLMSAALTPYWEDVEWSPDGRLLTFKVIGDGSGDQVEKLYVVAPSGPAAGTPQLAKSTGWIGGYVWSPDSTMIAFRDGIASGYALHVVGFSGDTPNPSVPVHGALVANGSVGPGFAWSPDSSRVLYLADQDTDEKDELYVSRVACGQLVINWKANQTLASDALDAVWSPDGNWIAYTALESSPSNYDVFVVRADRPNGYTPTQVNTSDLATDPQWATPRPAPPPACPD